MNQFIVGLNTQLMQGNTTSGDSGRSLALPCGCNWAVAAFCVSKGLM